MNWLLAFSTSLFFFFPRSQVALYLHVDHNDSSVIADVRINGKPAPFDKENGKYIIRKTQLRNKANRILISKPGFEKMVLDADSIFAQHGHRNAVTSAITLRHPWDGGYLLQGNKVSATISSTGLLIMGVKDSAAVFRAVRGLNLMVMRAFNYCGNFTKGGNGYANPETYALMHCYGAPLQKVNSQALKTLRTLFGDEKVGPAVNNNMFPKLLTNQLEVRFHGGITELEITQILKIYDLTLFYQDGYVPGLVIAKADSGVGDHIIGIANRLQLHPKVHQVSNIVNAMACPS